MCTSSDKFIFCSCENESMSQIDSKTLEGYSWSLRRFIKSEWNGMKGIVKPPLNDLGNEVTIDNIISVLNSNNGIFDFNYKPCELDLLSISFTSLTKTSSYFSVIYEDGLWVEGRYATFHTISKHLKDGNIKKTSEEGLSQLKNNLSNKEYLFEDIESKNLEDFKYKKKRNLWNKFLSLFNFLACI